MQEFSSALANRRCAMRITRITVSVIVALSIVSTAYAQEPLKGKIVTVDKASKKIGIQLSGTVGSSDTTAPTPFKVQDARMFNSVKPGDKVSFTAEREDGTMIIKEIIRE
jgi:Cu/Ag efflux protein CusF